MKRSHRTRRPAASAGIGDSRAYRLRDGQLEQLTKDHSLADALVEAGTITREEVPNHKFKNVLYLYLGSKDARERPGGRPGAGRPAGRPVPDGQRRPDRGRLATTRSPRSSDDVDDPQHAAELLKNLALANDSKDNVTCLVVHVVGETPSPWRLIERPTIGRRSARSVGRGSGVIVPAVDVPTDRLLERFRRSVDDRAGRLPRRASIDRAWSPAKT